MVTITSIQDTSMTMIMKKSQDLTKMRSNPSKTKKTSFARLFDDRVLAHIQQIQIQQQQQQKQQYKIEMKTLQTIHIDIHGNTSG